MTVPEDKINVLNILCVNHRKRAGLTVPNFIFLEKIVLGTLWSGVGIAVLKSFHYALLYCMKNHCAKFQLSNTNAD